MSGRNLADLGGFVPLLHVSTSTIRLFEESNRTFLRILENAVPLISTYCC
jgi:hypothetical protein